MVRWKVEIIPEECHSGESSGFRCEWLRPAGVKDNIVLNPRINVPPERSGSTKAAKSSGTRMENVPGGRL